MHSLEATSNHSGPFLRSVRLHRQFDTHSYLTRAISRCDVEQWKSSSLKERFSSNLEAYTFAWRRCGQEECEHWINLRAGWRDVRQILAMGYLSLLLKQSSWISRFFSSSSNPWPRLGSLCTTSRAGRSLGRLTHLSSSYFMASSVAPFQSYFGKEMKI